MPAAIKVFIPRDLVADPVRLARAVTNALDGAAEGAKVDFETTTATWKHRVAFQIDKGRPDRRIVGTDDEIYGYVTEGTPPHIIVPRNGKVLTWIGNNYRPKTRPRQIRSNKGGNNNTIVFTKIVQHPGTEAREFEQAIAEKWQKELPVTFQRAIDAEM